MKIIYFALTKFPNNSAAANRIINNAKLFAELRHEIKLFGFIDTIDNNESGEFEGVVFQNMAMKKKFFRFPKIKMILAIIKKERPNAIVFYNFPSWIQLGVIKYCKKNNIKIIGDIAEWYTNLIGNPFFKFIKWIDVNFRMNFLNKRLDGLIVISSLLFDKYRGGNVVLLPPLVDIKQDIWSQKIDKEKKRFLFLYNGSTANNKDYLQHVFNALEIVKNKNIDFTFLIAGIDKISIRSQNYIISNDIDSHIKFVGFIPHAESIKLLLEADVSIIPRISNLKTNAGFPTKFVEAITAGTYVMTTDISDVKSYINNKNGEIILAETLACSLINFTTKHKYKTNIDHSKLVNTFDFREYKQTLKEFITITNGRK